MPTYKIKDYQKGYEEDLVRIGFTVARRWVWPYAFDLEDLLQVQTQPHFDPDTWLYCFYGSELVGYMFFQVESLGEGEASSARLDFPRMLPGHEKAAELLIAKAFEILAEKGVSRIVGRVTTMCPGDIALAEKSGFVITDWGHKVYYAYEMKQGKLMVPGHIVEEVDPERDLDSCAKLAVHWYGRSPAWCRSYLEDWHKTGLITHLGVREQGELIAGCLVGPNNVRPSTAAIFYIYTPDEHCLRPLLAKVVSKCVDYGTHDVIADLVNEHRQFEPVYQELGFKKVAEWAHCEKYLMQAR